YFRTTDVTGVAELPAGMEMVMPGDNVEMVVELIAPIAMDEGLRFAIREGGRTVGAGRVTQIIKSPAPPPPALSRNPEDRSHDSSSVRNGQDRRALESGCRAA